MLSRCSQAAAKKFSHLSRGCLERNSQIIALTYSTSSAATQKENHPIEHSESIRKKPIVPHEFRHVFPDFLPEADFERRHPIAEKLIRSDMLKRRMNIDIPEFYVGSILAVTCSDPYAPKRMNRFVGLCIERDMRGLWHQFMLRNVIDGIAVEVPYDMYNPLIQSIQVLRLEKRPDEHLLYLRDALLEYSTVPFDMQPEPLPPGAAVPVNMTKVKLKQPPWSKKWHLYEMHGIEEMWEHFCGKRKWAFLRAKRNYYRKYDIVAQYRRDTPLQDQQEIYEHVVDFEEQNQLTEKRIAGRKITTVSGHFKARQEKSGKQISSPTQSK